jgi:DNA-directed RNA polymerase subunit E'/Rpb7
VVSSLGGKLWYVLIYEPKKCAVVFGKIDRSSGMGILILLSHFDFVLNLSALLY